MITNPIVLCILVACAALLAAAALAPFIIPQLTRVWRSATPLGRFVFVSALSIAALYGGSKTNDVDDAGGSVTNQLMGLARRFLAPVFRATTVTPEEVARGWQIVSVETNANVCYAMPDGAALATNWWVRGAYEDVAKVGDLWAFSWGKVRFDLASASNELTAVGAPMSAVPFRSRLWSATATNDSLLVTWEDFALGRDTNTPVSAQLEFRADGNCIARSNDVETAWRRIDPNDFDGDGYLNGDDLYPYAWDDGADDFYGPDNELPQYCNSNAYYTVTVRIEGSDSHWVTFIGDGYSYYQDPEFLAKPGVPYDVKLLIGKTYLAESDTTLVPVGRSSEDVEIEACDTNAFTVVWPVTITDAPAPVTAPPPGLLGAPLHSDGFTLHVIPDCLYGIFSWESNHCCQVTCVDDDNLFQFTCEDDCSCGGCEIGGSYHYEGYTVLFGGIHCGCTYEPDPQTTFGLTAPAVVFKDGALRPLVLDFSHGDPISREEGTLTLERTGAQGNVRIWQNPNRTSPATTFSWDASSFSGCTYYLEGVNASESVNDINFRFIWTRPGGSVADMEASTTCAEVLQTDVMSLTSGITDGSINPQPFAGHTNWEFNVTHSPNPDKHFSVLFRDVVNTNDFSVRDFTIQMSLVVQPVGAPVGSASWFALDPTPNSGLIVGSGPRTGELRNPKVGGVYHIGSFFDGSPTNECNIVLPLAGAEMSQILAADLSWADRFAVTGKEHLPKRWIERVKFGCKWFNWLENGFYRGRPDNHQHPTIWHYNQIRDFDGLGAVGTLKGRPIRVEKLSNFIAGYTCVKIGVPWHERILAQAIGTTNDLSATLSWQAGEYVAAGIDFETSISDFLENAHLDSDEKTSKLWPNTAPVDNHRGYPGHGNFNVEFSSPGFIYAQP